MTGLGRKLMEWAAIGGIALSACQSPQAVRSKVADPEVTFLNPVIKGYFADPSVLRDGDDYYAIMSSHCYYPALTIWHSRDLVNWTPVSYALDTYMGSIWAPDLVKYEDTYYIYFTNKQFPGDPYPTSNYVITAKEIGGPWSKPVDIGKGEIDPGHLVDVKTKQRWVYTGGGHMARLSDDGRAIEGATRKVYDGWVFPEEWEVESFALEGPKFIFKDGYYYACWAEGGTHGPPTSHMVIVARSRTVDGPWENSPYNPIVRTVDRSEKWWSKGHGTIFQTKQGAWYMIYHAYENGYRNMGRQALLEPISWTEDGWPVLEKGSDPSKPIKKPLTGFQSPKFFIGDSLDRFRVGYEWWFHEEYDTSRFHVDNGVLVLKAEGLSLSGGSNPVVFNAGEHAYSVSVEVEKSPTAHAGLVTYYDKRAFAGVGVNGSELMRYRRSDEVALADLKLEDPNHFHLKIVNRFQSVTMYYSDNGKDWKKIMSGVDVAPYQHNMLYGSKACLPGLFVAGSGEARFKNVKFEVLK